MTNIFDNAGSVIHDNKRVASIVTGDGGVIYEAPCVEFTFTGTTLTQYSSGSFRGIDMVIDYGDGTVETTTGKFGHTYSQSGTYTVKIYGVSNLNQSCFEGCTGLTSILIPDTVVGFGSYCFWNCTNLTLIAIPNSITSIPDYCLYGCSNLSSMILNWTTSDQIITYRQNWFGGSNTSKLNFKIPAGTKSLYIAKGYPSNKLDDGTIISSVNLNATKTTLSKSHNDTTTLTATVMDSNNQSVSDETVQIYNGNTLIGTMTESNGTYSYTYTSQGNGDLSLNAKCKGVSSSSITVYDYLLVPPLDSTDAITTWTSATNNTSNGVFNSHGSYLSNGWDNSDLWQLDFDVKTSSWKYIGLMPVCASGINPFTDAKVAAYAMTCWEGISFFGGMGLSSWDSYPSNFSKITSTNTSYHITIKKLSSTKLEIHIGNYVAIGNYDNLPNHSTLYIGTRDNPSSRNYGGVPQLSNIVVKPL